MIIGTWFNAEKTQNSFSWKHFLCFLFFAKVFWFPATASRSLANPFQWFFGYRSTATAAVATFCKKCVFSIVLPHRARTTCFCCKNQWNSSRGKKLFLSSNIVFLNMGHPRLFSSFKTNKCEKCLFSILWCDSNPCPSEHEAPPIATRPRLQSNGVCVPFEFVYLNGMPSSLINLDEKTVLASTCRGLGMDLQLHSPYQKVA